MEDGVWRTIGGRRVFIKEGQSLGDAMKESGKFPKSKKVLKAEEIEEQVMKIAEKNTKLHEELDETQRQLNSQEYEYLKERGEYIRKNYPSVGKGSEKYKQIRQEYDNQHKKDYNIENQEIYKKYNEAKAKWQKYRDKNIEFFENDYTYDKQLKEYLIKEANGYDDIASRMFSADTKEYDKLKTFSKLAKENDFVITKSPYGSSMYAIPKGDYVDWGYKPTDSYRLADHWGFESQGQIHCRLGDNKEYITDLEIGKWNGSYYEKI